MLETNNATIRVCNFFTNENPGEITNASGSYGIIPNAIDSTHIKDGLTERGAGLGKLGSSMPSPMARLFLFSAALREINDLEGQNPNDGHKGKEDENGNFEPTPYHDLVGEMLDMLEFVFKYGDDPDFHVQRWDVVNECQALDESAVPAHKQLASALRSAFEFGVLRDQPIYLFFWKEEVFGGTSPISLVYTSANLRTSLGRDKFTGVGGNVLFSDKAVPLHKRDVAFREYLYRLGRTDLASIQPSSPLYQLSKYIQDSATHYDIDLDNIVRVAPDNFNGVKNLQTQGTNVKVAGVQLRVSDHTIVIDKTTSDYLLKPSVNYYQRGNSNVSIPMILVPQGVDGLKYAAGRPWNTNSDSIDAVLPKNIYERHLPGLGRQVKYPFLTISDFFEDKIIEVSYEINKDKFFTGCKKEISFLLPLRKVFFEYFSLNDLVDEKGNYTDMLVVEHDEEHAKLTIRLNLPLINGHKICLYKKYNTSEDSIEKIDCYDGANTFDFAVFPFYRLEPDTSHNIYNVMVGSTMNGVSVNFFEPNQSVTQVDSVSRRRTSRGPDSQLTTDHVRVKGAFTFMELTVPSDGNEVKALVLPIFKKVNSDLTKATDQFTFSIDFGTTNTHVSYVKTPHGQPFGHNQVQSFNYNEDDTQMVMFNNREGSREFGSFPTALKRELVPSVLGETVKFPMRTATYQVAGNPNGLEMFFNTNIGFNYGEDISRSRDYKTNIKWDRFDNNASDRMSTFFAQMLWMMKNKSVLNNGSDSFTLVVTYPISMRPNDSDNFKRAWDNAKAEVQCNVDIRYRTESVAPYYSYLAGLQYGKPYANMDIGGGTTDILYVNPFSGEASVFSAFFAANDLWNDGIDCVNRSSKDNGFVRFYKMVQLHMLGDKRNEVESVIKAASSSSDIISYLFVNDDWTKLSNTIRRSPKMMQLPIIHFSALAFYMAYVLHMAEVEIPRNLSFTGMGSKYIRLISNVESVISQLVNAIFKYVGVVLNNSKLQEANVNVSFAPNPKEVTAIGALISLNYAKAINASEDIYYGYEEEEPGKVLRYKDISSNIQDSVGRLFNKFTRMFYDDDVLDVLSDLGYSVDNDIVVKLADYAAQSLQQMKDSSSEGQNSRDKLKEPMFFWSLKNSLYIIGKELSESAANEINGGLHQYK